MRARVSQELKHLSKDEMGRFLLKGISSTFVMNLAGRLSSFILFVILARILGVTEFGVYVLAWSWGQLLLVFGKFGTDASAMRYVAAYKAKEEWGLFYGHLRYGFLLVTLKSLSLAAIGAAVIWYCQDQIGPTQAAAFWITMLLLPLQSQIHFVQACLRALHLNIKGVIANTVIRPALQIPMAFALLIPGIAASAANAMLTAVVACIVALGLALYWLRAQLHDLPKPERKAYAGGEWYRYAFYILLIASGDMIFRQTDVIMLGAMIGPEEAGLYGAASRIAYFVIFGISAANFVIAPMISQFNATHNHEKLQSVVTYAAHIIFGLALIMSLGIFMGGHWLLWLFGPEFKNALSTLNIMIAGQLLVALVGPVGSLMIMTGHERFTSYIFIMTALLNVVLNALLIPDFGKDGAAIATAISFAFWNGICLIYILRYLHINPTIMSTYFVFARKKSN